MMTSNIYAPVELKLNNLIVQAPSSLTEDERERVRHFKEHREYAIALEVFVDIVIDGQRSLSTECLETVEELAAIMKITDEIDFEQLRRLAH